MQFQIDIKRDKEAKINGFFMRKLFTVLKNSRICFCVNYLCECSGTPRRLIKLKPGNNPFRGAARDETKKKSYVKSKYP
jgi:hypothetical protein